MFTGDHLAFRAVRPMEAQPFTSEDDKLSVFECAPRLRACPVMFVMQVGATCTL